MCCCFLEKLLLDYNPLEQFDVRVAVRCYPKLKVRNMASIYVVLTCVCFFSVRLRDRCPPDLPAPRVPAGRGGGLELPHEPVPLRALLLSKSIRQPPGLQVRKARKRVFFK